MSEYTIGQEYKAKYDNPPIPKEHQFSIDAMVDILDEEKRLMARFRVETTDEYEVGGKILSTFGHRRKKHNAKN